MFLRTLRSLFYQGVRQQYNLVGQIKSLSRFLIPKRSPHVLLWIPTITTVHTFGWSRESKGPNLSMVDKLFDENKFEEICAELSKYKDEGDVEVLWRYARALYKMSKEAPNEKERQRLVYEGFELAEKALKKGDHISPVHKWYSILLDAKSNFEGTKARIIVTEKVKQHMLKAVELNPKDSTTLYMLGLWCFEVTVLPWYQRKIAATIFATPPTSTFEEALEFCERAEKISPNFYSLNLLLIGKIYDRLGQRDKAIPFLKRAKAYPASNHDDHTANKEAAELLKSWGVKN